MSSTMKVSTSKSCYKNKVSCKYITDSISILFLEWNPLTTVPIRRDIFISAVRPSLQHLILRENNLGNQICTEIINKIKETPEIVIKSLDLTGN